MTLHEARQYEERDPLLLLLPLHCMGKQLPADN
jgi:hypothetical protein